MPFIDLEDIRFHYKLEGDGAETIVLINGLGDDLDSWALQMDDFLGAGLRVLRFDNRGVGRSDSPAGPYTTRQMANDAKALVDALGVREFHLMGVSMGGMIAQEYVLAYPGDLISVTFACTYAAPGPFCSRMFGFWGDLAPVMGVNFVMRDVALWAFTSSFFSERAEDAAEFERAMRYVNQPTTAYLAQLASIQSHDTTARIKASGVPTLVLAGESDILIPVALSRDLHQLVPGARWETTPGGHACMWEYPREFNAAVIDFVRGASR